MRTGIYTFLGIVGLVLGVVMFMALSSVSDNAPSENNSVSTYALNEYLPNKSSVWEYSDGKAFRKVMVTERLFESDKFTHLIVKGEEDDKSIKSFRNRYQFEYTYKVDEEKIVRTTVGNNLIDSYKEVTLLKMPLSVGNHWKESWQSPDGTEHSIVTTIKSIENDGDTVIIESVEGNKLFTLIRQIERGKGVVEVSIIEDYDGTIFETGFQLLNFAPFEHEGFDNYMALLGNEKIGTVIDTIASSDEILSPEEGTEKPVAKPVEDIVIKENDEIDDTIKEEIIESVKLFNDKWILFINEGDMAIMDTITPNASVETIIEAYMNKEMTQKFNEMQFKRIVLQGDVANAYVYEEIERTMDGSTEVLKYNWIYEIDKIDGKWLVEGYIENETP